MALGTVAKRDCCEIKITEGAADSVDIINEPFHSLKINKPSCCNVVVTTSAGVLTLRKPEVLFGYDFKCPITIESVEVTDCDPENVYLTLIHNA